MATTQNVLFAAITALAGAAVAAAPAFFEKKRQREVASILTDAQLAEEGPDWRPY
jgi:hypothetical protein